MKRFLLFLLLFLLPSSVSADLEAHFLDVGHGDCTILISNGEVAIIDGGPVSASDMVFTYLHDLGVTDIKYAFATHPQTDHVGGLPAAFHATTVHALYTPVTESSNDRFNVLLEKAHEMNVPVIIPTVGDQLSLGDAIITVLSPSKAYTDENDMSLVLRVTSPNMTLMICGDAGSKVEKDLIAAGTDLTADVLRISHHGSDNATTPAFLREVVPQYAVISCSERYDNPDPDIMERLLDNGITVLCTDYIGTITTTGSEIKCEKWYVGNMNSEIFHRHTCASVDKMKEKNKCTLYSREEAMHKDYRPCKNCSP